MSTTTNRASRLPEPAGAHRAAAQAAAEPVPARAAATQPPDGLLTREILAPAARVAGPHRIGRLMRIAGVPLQHAPLFGPLIGGSLIEVASWRWIFFVILPVGLVAIVAAARLLPAPGGRSAQRLDVPGAVLLSGGLAAFLYRMAQTSQHAQWATPAALGPMAARAVGVALFLRHARPAAHPPSGHR